MKSNSETQKISITKAQGLLNDLCTMYTTVKNTGPGDDIAFAWDTLSGIRKFFNAVNVQLVVVHIEFGYLSAIAVGRHKILLVLPYLSLPC